MEKKAIPQGTEEALSLPAHGRKEKKLPSEKQSQRKMPKGGAPENTIMIGDTLVEVKPTKLKYQRNRTATLYKLLDIYPLTDVLAMEAGAFGEDDERDGDKAVFDWLIAVLDDEPFVRACYDEMDTETIER